ncbi:isoprenyl transferase [Dellaglioa carnosa]|uniref:Isoprenyl transferase n=1 Tax=Dellaglioa carnosa TaxID=2995136 RepID=A0ABT4JKP6_9LACO|nr:isoprenyl transferase [Dellaglioa carnosa]MCZ2490850.1 isoprenyl transferase [Dellaglioa carnosa]MCZ2493928.1 isoprenyl transferase [Dellaglioa carnosa]MDK1730792.1 isoprenyl transferase [Dellaglioa carnosa]
MVFNLKKNKTSEEIQLDPDKMPNHVAIIMDGNGRWAKKRHLPRIAGHKTGMDTVKTVTMAANDLGIKVLTLYAFSTENWKRPETEVNYLMSLPGTFFDKFVPELIEKNVKVNVMGYIDQLPNETKIAVRKAIEDTKNNTGMILNFALNYGGRAEIVTAMQEIAADATKGKIDVADITDKTIDQYLMTANLAPYNDPELLIRTSGEERISNFLLWQIAYSELVFTDTLWPDFSEDALKDAIFNYQKRDRRFGGIKE